MFFFFGCVFRFFSVSIRGFCNFCMPNFFSVSPYGFMKIDENLNHFVEIIEEIFRVSKSSLFQIFGLFFDNDFWYFCRKIKNNVFCSGFWGGDAGDLSIALFAITFLSQFDQTVRRTECELANPAKVDLS